MWAFETHDRNRGDPKQVPVEREKDVVDGDGDGAAWVLLFACWPRKDKMLTNKFFGVTMENMETMKSKAKKEYKATIINRKM